jgi:phytoene dehydrogenase-like protein
MLSGAMIKRLKARGGEVLCGTPVVAIDIRSGRATAVRTEQGEEIRARKAVIADVDAPQLYSSLVSYDHLPVRYRDDLARFQWDYATLKFDWAVNGGIPWTADAASRAGTIHLAGSVDEMTAFTSEIARRLVPTHPFILLGQLSTADPSRSPEGTQSAWAYTHLPRQIRGDPLGRVSGRYDDADREALADRIEGEIERYAPGFRDRIMARRVMLPTMMQSDDRAMPLGALNSGTCAVHQQLIFRPTPGLGRAETPISGLYLASASAHPGGGVHGVCGANAARAALRDGCTLGRFVGAGVVRLSRRSAKDVGVTLGNIPKVPQHPAIPKTEH